MRPINEILIKLENEFIRHLGKINSIDKTLVYYNEMLGHTSILLAGLLESLLKKKFNDWDTNKWIDDSLISEVYYRNTEFIIEGVIIWGRKNTTTEQWVDPFSFKIEYLNNRFNFKKSIFKFCDLESHEISYEKYKEDRNFWKSKDRNWKYVIELD
jgi:hypothetical protein